MSEELPTTPEGRLAALIACRTVSAPNERDEAEFVRFRELFARFYPLMHSELELEVIGQGTLLFHWAGRSAEDPIVLMAHYDVVPASGQEWEHDPFAGVVRDGWVHGRGALDDKGPLVALVEAVEGLLAEGHTPDHDVWLCLGHDEEVFGTGASQVVDLLEERRVRPWLVNDEGGAIVTKPMPGLKGRHAMIAIVEKGTVDVELIATGDGGHASAPSPGGPVSRIAEAVRRIDRAGGKPALTDPVRQMLGALVGSAPAPLRPVLRGLFRAEAVTARVLARLGPETAAMVRTTMAPTVMSGSPANNVLATEARLNVNVRLLPGDTISALRARLEKLVKGLDVEIASVKGENPPPVSPTDSAAWQHLVAAVAAVDPKIKPVPFMIMGGTDSRHFTRISGNVHRFAPLDMDAEQRATIHAAGEKLEVASLRAGISFHRALLTLPRPKGS